jgi:hypothetical protein
VHKSKRQVIITPNPVTDSALISITGKYNLKTLKISIQRKSGQTVMEFIPRQIPFKMSKGDLDPGLYYIRCIDKYGRIPSKKMKIIGNTPTELE